MASNPYHPLLLEGIESLKAQDRVTAVSKFKDYLRKFPKDPDGWVFLARVSKPSSRLTYLQNALDIDPDHETAQKLFNQITKEPPLEDPIAVETLTPRKDPTLVEEPTPIPVSHTQPSVEVMTVETPSVSEMKPDSEITRIIGAQIVLDNKFREIVFDIFSDRSSFAPEFNLDVKAILRIAKSIENDQKFAERVLYAFRFFFSVGLVVTFFQFGLGLMIAGAFFALGIVINFYNDRRFVTRYLKKFESDTFSVEKLAEEFSSVSDKELEEVLPKKNQNFIAYSGFKPFVGAGIEMNGWAFPISLLSKNANDGEGIIPFDEADIYASIEENVLNLKLDGLEMRDYVYANGRDIEAEKDLWMPNAKRPKQVISSQVMQKYASEHSYVARYYKWISVSSWGGEVVQSFFLRFARKGNLLFIEFSQYLLPPISDRFREIDDVYSTNFFEQAKSSLISSVITYIFSIPLVIIAPFQLWSWWEERQADKAVEKAEEKFEKDNEHRRVILGSKEKENHGALKSLRELVAGDSYQHFFQQKDAQMYKQIVEKEIIETLSEFFDAHNVSTTEFGQKTQTIINNVDNSMKFGDNTNMTNSNLNAGGEQSNSGTNIANQVGNFIDNVTKG
ncbi:MAG: hypothetical protein Phog2KO_27260 [Phototrophicaceae bacterium]